MEEGRKEGRKERMKEGRMKKRKGGRKASKWWVLRVCQNGDVEQQVLRVCQNGDVEQQVYDEYLRVCQNGDVEQQVNDEYLRVCQNGDVEQQVRTRSRFHYSWSTYCAVQYITVQYSTIGGEVDWILSHSIYTYITRFVSHMARHARIHCTIYLFIREEIYWSR